MPKRVLTGTVVSDKGEKTVVVRVERRVKHPLYGKIIRLSKKYHAHDEGNAYRSGEQVRIQECAPVSKLKSWTVLDRIGAAIVPEIEDEAPVAKKAPEAKTKTPAKSAAKTPKNTGAKKPAATKAKKAKETADSDA
jgi:small subunit ribosomal protein S17